MKYLNIIILLAIFSVSGFCQQNQTDTQGRKQGYWKKIDNNGNLIYEGYFKDNKPVDTLKRYYENGNLKVKMVFSDEHDTVYSIMYFEEGKISGEGRYFNKMKVGLWKYYSAHFDCLMQEDIYKMGKKDGICVNYYQNGSPNEILQYKEGIKHGKWMQFFEDGQMKFQANYENDKLNGEYINYRSEGRIEIKGIYKNDLKDGLWQYYDERGNLDSEIIYHDGVAENEEELKAIQQKYMDYIEQNQGKFQEPDASGGVY